MFLGFWEPGGPGKGRQGTIPDQTLAETAVVAAERGVNQPDGNAKKQNPQNAKTKMLWRDGPKCWWCAPESGKYVEVM